MQKGDVVGDRFVLGDAIGEGGFGAVFEARDTQSDEPVAIKFLRGVASDADKRRFGVEAAALRRLRHPGCVAVHGFGHTPQGSPYLVMERLRGHSLADEPIPMAIARILRIGVQVAEALRFAHKRRILHRDIKPPNIFVTQSDGAEVAKLLDFGLAKLVDAKSGPTRTGEFAGTPHYASPEQLRGLKEAEASSDIYSLGVVLYELVEGRLPFDGETSAEQALGHYRLPPRPMQRSDCPAKLEATISEMLAKKPAERPQNAKEVAKRLTAILQRLDGGLEAVASTDLQVKRPVMADTDVDTLQYQKDSRPWPVIFSVAAGVALVAVVGMFLSPGEPQGPVRVVPPVSVSVAAPPTPSDDVGVVDTRLVEADASTDLGLSGVGCGNPNPPQGTYVWKSSHRDRAVAMTYPDNYDPTTPHPILFAFHRQPIQRHIDAGDFVKEARLDLVATRTNAVVLTVAPVQRRRPWGADDADVLAVLDLLTALDGEICIDGNRISAFGHDAGAFMSIRLAQAIPLTALVLIQDSVLASGTDLLLSGVRVENVLRIYADSDSLVPINGGESCVPTGVCKISWGRSILRDARTPRICEVRDLASAEEIVEMWRAHLGCDAEPQPWRANVADDCKSWRCGEGNFATCVTPGGHGLPTQKTEDFWQGSECYVESAQYPYVKVIVPFLRDALQ